jgi:hypothetical protein
MKFLSILLILLLFSCKSKPINSERPKFTKTTTEKEKLEIDSEIKTEQETNYERFVILKPIDLKTNQLKLAENFGSRLLGMCNNYKFKKFTTAEATEKVIGNIDLEKMTKTCQKIFFRNGKFIYLELIEIRQDNETGEIGFRFDIIYEKKFFKRELKLILNAENKLSFIATKQISKIIK